MKYKEILYAISSEKPRKHQNGWFGFTFLAASIITAILTIVFFALASKKNDNLDFNFFQWLAYIMIFATAIAIGTGIYFVIMKKRYTKHCQSIYESGKNYNATILEVIKKIERDQNNTVYTRYAIKYSFTADDKLIEATTKYIFGQSEIEYFQTLNYFPIVYNKKKNQYLYFLYVT